MTREESIKRIQDFIGWFKKDSDIYEALEMAIQALSQEPCDDAISREDAVHALRKALWDYEDKTEKQFRERDDLDYGEWYFHRIFVQAMNDEDVETICKLPSVTQKSKTGHWSTYENYQGGIKETWYECSECKWSSALLIPRKYCPNCGTDMKG